MPRVAGQIDLAKSEAILDAAAEVFAARGVSAGMDDIARLAGVSKQTIYNHYGSKIDLVRALVTRRVREITAPLDLPGAVENPEEALAAFGRVMLGGLLNPRNLGLLRLAVLTTPDLPQMGRAFYEAGIIASRQRLAEFLQVENAAGRLDTPDPHQAAQTFSTMVIGPYQLSSLLGIDEILQGLDVDAVAREAAARFMRAYAPRS